MNYYVAGKNSGLCILTLKDLQEILFRENKLQESMSHVMPLT